ncbi:MAG: tetratricopeptide repeat protein [Rhodospirillaceae bacterium]|nr:tetratricopeptide repeat protein [Rhodospirillaceae bacterium]MCY4238782.1 tetratricopeptide repeat protein [Rhodospirillaceae bacterium]
MASNFCGLRGAETGERFLARKRKDESGGVPAGEMEREQDLFIREVNEEIKQERYIKTWKKYGQYFVGVALIAIGSVAAWQWYKSGIVDTQHAQSVDFTNGISLADAGSNQQAGKVFEKLARETEGGYAALARLRQAALVAKAGDVEAAAALYLQLSSDDKLSVVFRNLGTVMWGLHALDTANPDEAIARLKPLTSAGQTWRYTALELTAHYHRKAGRNTDAARIFNELFNDADVPGTLRQRAGEFLSIIGKS